MACPLAGEEWMKAMAEVLNTDERYAEAAKNWEGEILVLVEPDKGSPTGVRAAGAYLNLWPGQCPKTAACLELNPGTPKPTFTLRRAPRSLLLRIMEGKLDRMQAMVTRRLEVEANLGCMMRNVPTVLDFVRCCRRVEIAS